MNRPNIVFPRSTILWTRVLGLASLQGAIALLWVIYNLYLPQLLGQFGFSAAFLAGLLVVENLLGVGMEPLMGSLSDRAQRFIGSRFPFIAVGVVLASACFIAIPASVVLGSPEAGVRWMLPIVSIAWALAMTVFRSPALSLLGSSAIGSGLPQAASVLTLVGALVGAVGLAVNQFILRLGAPVAFTAASLILLASAAVLRFVHPPGNDRPPSPEQPPTAQRPLFQQLGLTFGVGLGITLGFLLLRKLLNGSPGTTLTLFTLAHLISILPAGVVVSRVGTRRAMIAGLGCLVLLMGVVAIAPAAIQFPPVVVALGISFSPVAVSVLPFALSQVPSAQAGLGTGIYFGGASLASSLFGSFLASPTALPATATAFLASLLWLEAAFCVAIATRLAITADKSE